MTSSLPDPATLELAGLDGRTRPLVRQDPPLGHTLLTFFKVDCPTCRFLAPFLHRFHDRFASPDLRFLAVSQSDRAETEAFAHETGFQFPVLLDSEGLPASRRMEVRIVPTLCLLSPSGSVETSHGGFMKQALETLAARLGEITGRPGDPVWAPDEEIPQLKPG